MVSFKETLSKFISSAFILSVYVPPKFVTAINFFPTFETEVDQLSYHVF